MPENPYRATSSGFLQSVHVHRYTVVGDGRDTPFWVDKWIQGESVLDIAPNLAQLVSGRTLRLQTVRQAITNRQWIRSITGGLTMNAIAEYLELWNTLLNVHLNKQPD
jgi:hypothetical protein